MRAFYNEIDRYKCDWLQNSMDASLITPGIIDDRSIADIGPDDVRGFERVHFFAGVGLWDYALNLAGWPAGRNVCSGSCPCPPFSSAGKKKACPGCGGTNPVPCPIRTGFFICCLCEHAWDADQRHLWPEFWRVIRDARFDVVFGEQVSSEDGRTWLDIVRASLEIMDYRTGYQDSCSSGIGAPNIRQRLYWVAESLHAERRPLDVHRENGCDGLHGGWQETHGHLGARREVCGLAHADGGLAGDADLQRGWKYGQQPKNNGTGDVALTAGSGQQRHAIRSSDAQCAPTERSGTSGGMDNASRPGSGRNAGTDAISQGEGESTGISARDQERGPRSSSADDRAGPLNGFWRNADWLFCTDGRWRPVRPGAFVLASGDSGRVRIHRTVEGQDKEHVYSRTGALKGFGDAINVEVAAAFVRAYLESEGLT